MRNRTLLSLGLSSIVILIVGCTPTLTDKEESYCRSMASEQKNSYSAKQTYERCLEEVKEIFKEADLRKKEEEEREREIDRESSRLRKIWTPVLNACLKHNDSLRKINQEMKEIVERETGNYYQPPGWMSDRGYNELNTRFNQIVDKIFLESPKDIEVITAWEYWYQDQDQDYVEFIGGIKAGWRRSFAISCVLPPFDYLLRRYNHYS